MQTLKFAAVYRGSGIDQTENSKTVRSERSSIASALSIPTFKFTTWRLYRLLPASATGDNFIKHL
jgi:hypothetical protein